MDYYLIINSDGTKTGPFTDDPSTTLTPGQTVTILSDAEYIAYDAARSAVVAKEQALIECQQARAKRYSAEASTFEIADAITKQASVDPIIKAEGDAQLAAVLEKRLQIKLDLPKPQ